MDLAGLIDLEKASRDRAELAIPAHDAVLALLPQDHWVVRMHVARLLPRLELSGEEYDEAIQFLFAQADGANKFVAAWALDSLSQFATRDPTLLSRVVERLEGSLGSESPAIRVRAREGLKRLGLGTRVRKSTHHTG